MWLHYSICNQHDNLLHLYEQSFSISPEVAIAGIPTWPQHTLWNIRAKHHMLRTLTDMTSLFFFFAQHVTIIKLEFNVVPLYFMTPNRQVHLLKHGLINAYPHVPRAAYKSCNWNSCPMKRATLRLVRTHVRAGKILYPKAAPHKSVRKNLGFTSVNRGTTFHGFSVCKPCMRYNFSIPWPANLSQASAYGSVMCAYLQMGSSLH